MNVIKIDSEAVFRLLNLKTGTYATVSTDDNESVIGKAYDALNDGQKWKLIKDPQDDRQFAIKSGGRYLALAGDQIVKGSKVQVNTSKFTWKVSTVEDMAPAYRFTISADVILYLNQAGATDKTDVQEKVSYGDNSEIWVLVQTTA